MIHFLPGFVKSNFYYLQVTFLFLYKIIIEHGIYGWNIYIKLDTPRGFDDITDSSIFLIILHMVECTLRMLRTMLHYHTFPLPVKINNFFKGFVHNLYDFWIQKSHTFDISRSRNGIVHSHNL